MNEPQRPPSRAFGPRDSPVWGLTLTQIIGWGALYHSFPVYLKPMQQEFGWSTTEFNMALTLALVVADLVAIPAGHWVDRHGGHAIMTFGAALGAALIALWSQVSSLPAFYLIYAGMGLSMCFSLGNMPAAVVTANVRDFRRGLAYLSFFSSLASTVAIPAASVLVGLFGWRQALVIQALLQICGPVCINAWILRGTRGARGGPREREPSPVKRVMRTRAFWLLALAFSVHWFTAMSMSIHNLPLMEERGLSRETAVSLVMLMGPASVVGRLATFYISPGNSGLVTGRIMFPLFTLGVFFLALTGSTGLPGFIAYAVTFGMAAGVLMVVRQTAVAEIFGTRGYGAITGALATVAILPRTTSPVVVAFLRDWFGGYDVVIWALFAMTLLGTIAFFLAAEERVAD